MLGYTLYKGMEIVVTLSLQKALLHRKDYISEIVCLMQAQAPLLYVTGPCHTPRNRNVFPYNLTLSQL